MQSNRAMLGTQWLFSVFQINNNFMGMLVVPFSVNQGRLLLWNPTYIFYIQVCLEGQISRQSAIQSLSNGNQPSGDQIPWKFCEQFRDTVFPSLSGARIVRIATHPNAMEVIFVFSDLWLCLTRLFQSCNIPLIFL
jgi:hypothetical protein